MSGAWIEYVRPEYIHTVIGHFYNFTLSNSTNHEGGPNVPGV